MPAATRHRLGRYWLWWRADRGDWAICWLEGRTVRRRSTGIKDGGGADPPVAALEALAAYHAAATATEVAPEAGLASILLAWLAGPASRTARAPAYGYAVRRILPWLEAAGLSQSTPAALTPRTVERYIRQQLATGLSPETVRGDLAAIRAATRWAWKEGHTPAAPYIADVPARDRRGPRTRTFTPAEVAAILNEAARRPDTHHVGIFALAMLATLSRVEAVLACNLDTQYDAAAGLIDMNEPGRPPTSKGRAVMRVCPTLARALEGRSGPLIRHQGAAVASIRTGWRHVLKRAAVPYAPPNTLRHTAQTEMHRAGVPEAQIETAAGHAGRTTGTRNYRHLRPEYLLELIQGLEGYFAALETAGWRREQYQRDTIPTIAAA